MPKNEKDSTIRSHRSHISGMQQFQGARDVTITGGSFRQIQGDYYDGGRDVASGLHILAQHIAADAMYNSAERFPPAKCHPGTRKKIISAILDWVNDPTPKERALWLNGPAGAGKSAIAHSVAVLLQEIPEDSKYAGSFFFAKDAIGRGDGTKLFSTISYQLALNFPSFRGLIDTAMLDDPTLPTKSIDVQLRYLIIEPLLRVNDWPAHSPTVIIDGLDECAGSKRMQSEILSLLSKAIIEHNIPLRFLIVSRPEYWISDSFEIGPLVEVTELLSLRDDEDADIDIKMYLQEGFNKIYEENIRIMSSTPRPWPPDYIICRFVRSASGQYIYASTVLEFVGASSDFCDPREQLRIVTTPGPHHASAFSDLDRLYATILSSYPRPNTMKRVLGGLLLRFSEKTIQETLGVDSGEIQLVLRALSSLIRISKVEYAEEFRVLEPVFGSPLVEASIRFCHLSFEEFLGNKSRSGEYAIDKSAIDYESVCATLKLGVDILQDSPRTEQTIARIGLSAYRRILEGLGFTQPIRCNARPVIRLLEELCESFHTIFARNPSHVAQSLTDVLNIAQKISAKQITDRSPTNSATWAYIALCLYGNESIIDGQYYIEEISESMDIGLDTIISDLQHLPDLVHLDFDHDAKGYIIDRGPAFLAMHHKAQGRCQENQYIAAWDHHIASHSAQCFNRIFHGSDQLFVHHGWHPMYTADCFLRYGRISDIHSKEYFEDLKKMEILNIIMDISFWDGLRDKSSLKLVLGALGWFNRQMTGPSIDIITDHDSSLPQKMLYAAKRIFEIAYLPYFTDSYCSNLWMRGNKHFTQSVSLHITPPSHDGMYSSIEEKPVNYWELPVVRLRSDRFHAWITEFHEQVFAKEGSSVINPYDWYPHLAAFLLTMLVKNRYAALNDTFEEGWSWKTIRREFFLLFIVCLPYAIPTEQNLNALRALHFICSRIHPQHQWRPPFGFCSLVIDFLKKYDRMSLSSRELNSLTDWLLGLMTCEFREIIHGINKHHILEDNTTDNGESSSTTTNFA
ncbi:hypothetical protein CVT25_008667 [Psilocybe cyanescens]|uniref:NACHT domain-containing protein n=1 Tax=Psilocybe cyanescens TaxID=93625 RepID=A0A409XLC1_PSICY|nr:hypothetical protein CVT25_008667 [Psilocybe cyanescens]